MMWRMHAHSPLSLPWDAGMADALAGVMAHVGTEAFDANLMAWLARCLTFDSCGVIEFFTDRPPHRRLHRFDKARRKAPEDAYVQGPYVLDPIYQLYQGGAANGLYPLRHIAPDDFEASEYFKVFYSRTDVGDDVSLLHRKPDGSAVMVFLERREQAPAFSQADLLALGLVEPVVHALLAQHEAHRRLKPASHDEALAHAKVQAALADFGSSHLTDREREVLFYMISGYSSALTAEKLAVAEGTVKNHRKAIHRKLDVGSQAELFALFLQCIPYAQPGKTVDPLLAYHSKPEHKPID
jgi:DNA-binding CsgD family transcriptional regulator